MPVEQDALLQPLPPFPDRQPHGSGCRVRQTTIRQQAVHTAACLLKKQHSNVLHGLFGLLSRVADMERLAAVEILRHLPAQEHHCSRAATPCEEVIVQIFTWIGMFGIAGLIRL